MDNPNYCEGDHECAEPTPFCDIPGRYAKDGINSTCIARPAPDAGLDAPTKATFNDARHDAAAPDAAGDAKPDGAADAVVPDAVIASTVDSAVADLAAAKPDARQSDGPPPPDEDGDGDPDDTDCAPTNKNIHHGRAELCNGDDDNCDGRVDEANATDCNRYYWDNDGDGHGVQANSICICSPTGTGRYTAKAAAGFDCDDAKPKVNPSATEDCTTAYDDDCDSKTNESSNSDPAHGCSSYYTDGDGDGFGTGTARCLCSSPAPAGVTARSDKFDCNDDNKDVNPDATEKCNGIDDDCDSATDEAGAWGCTNYYPDKDEDGYGALGPAACLCGPTAAYPTKDHSDCYDNNANAKPGQTEYFTTDRGDGSYDYDCDGEGKRKYRLAVQTACKWNSPSCSRFQQLYAFVGAVPECGQLGKWPRCVVNAAENGCENPTTEQKAQPCH